MLRTSALSLRTVHVLAVGLRGLFRQSLNLDVSQMEKCALGGLTCNEVDRDYGERMSVISMGTRQCKGNSSFIQSARDEKLTISVAALRQEQERRRVARITEAGISRSETIDHGADAGNDFEESWLSGGN